MKKPSLHEASEQFETAKARWQVIATDPEIRAMVQDVDQSLLDWFLSLTPMQRLHSASNVAHGLKRFKYVKTKTS
jgi:hypothetical protein